jgi:hypothetical protein
MNQLIYNDDDFFTFETKYSFEELENGFYKIDKPNSNNQYTIRFLAKGPSFGNVSTALEEATYINHITGNPFVRGSIFNRILFSMVVINVEFPDNEKLDSIDVSQCDMNSINYKLVDLICKEWRKTVL